MSVLARLSVISPPTATGQSFALTTQNVMVMYPGDWLGNVCRLLRQILTVGIAGQSGWTGTRFVVVAGDWVCSFSSRL